jgi:cytochrome c-type biogenesis protein CcmH/NrfG
MEDLILSGLAKRREERPDSADEFLRRLARATEEIGRPPAALAPSGAPNRAEGDTLVRPRSLDRARATRNASAVAVLALGAMLSIWSIRRAHSGRPSTPAAAKTAEDRVVLVAPKAAAAAALILATTPSSPLPARHGRIRESAHPVRAAMALPPLAGAEAMLARRDAAGACALAEQARTHQPGNAEVHRFLGKCYMRLGRIAEARQAYQEFLDLAPEDPDAPFVRAILSR